MVGFLQKETMKLLYFTDAHIRATSPIGRLDNFYQTVLEKLTEIRDYANDNQIDFVIHGGDLFDRPDSAIQPTSNVGKILASFEMPLYTVIGNHDIYGYNVDTVDRSMVGLLTSLGVIKRIPKEGIMLKKDDTKVLLMGVDYSGDLDQDPQNYIIKEEDIEGDPDRVINVVHGFLLDKPFVKGVPHVLIGEIIDTAADITLAGHYHSGFLTQEYEGKYFINPGSIVRISRSKKEVNRKPKFLIIDIDKDDIHIEELYLKSAKAGTEVMDMDKLNTDRYYKERMIVFQDEIRRNIDMDQINLDFIIDEIVESEDLDSVVRNEAKLRLDIAKGEIDDSNN